MNFTHSAELECMCMVKARSTDVFVTPRLKPGVRYGYPLLSPPPNGGGREGVV
jgi:hypothetical protein